MCCRVGDNYWTNNNLSIPSCILQNVTQKCVKACYPTCFKHCGFQSLVKQYKLRTDDARVNSISVQNCIVQSLVKRYPYVKVRTNSTSVQQYGFHIRAENPVIATKQPAYRLTQLCSKGEVTGVADVVKAIILTDRSTSESLWLLSLHKQATTCSSKVNS